MADAARRASFQGAGRRGEGATFGRAAAADRRLVGDADQTLATMVATDTSIKGMTGKPVIGVIGGTKSVGIDKFIVGYIQGARDINPNAEVKVAYSNNFGDPAVGLQAGS